MMGILVCFERWFMFRLILSGFSRIDNLAAVASLHQLSRPWSRLLALQQLSGLVAFGVVAGV